MADTLQTLTDLLKINSVGINDLGVSDLLNDAPFFAAMGADFASDGTTHKYVKETGAPVVGFRAINAGTELSKSTDDVVSLALTVLAASFGVDKALADAYQRGGATAWIAKEGRRHLKAAFAALESQVYYGNGSGGGFNGFTNQAALNVVTAEMVQNATGAGTDALTSVYLVRTNNDGTDVQLITGNNGEIQMSESVVQMMVDATGKKFPGYYTPCEGWVTMQIGGARSAGRICNIGTAAGKTLTDSMIYDALGRFPASRQPTHIVMNRRSVGQLRKSRTATNSTGAPAPRPTEVDGIPIIVTDLIVSNETLVAS